MRMNAFNDTGLGEPEQDANTALIELDKGIFVVFNLTLHQSFSSIFLSYISYYI